MSRISFESPTPRPAGAATRRAALKGAAAALAGFVPAGGRAALCRPEWPWCQEPITPDPDQGMKPAPTLSLDFLADYPHDQETGWQEDIQGVTHDETHWYFTQTGRLWRFPVEHPLSKWVHPILWPDEVIAFDIDDLPFGGYNHFGGIDYYDGLVYVPLEIVGGPWDHAFPPIVLRFTPDLRLVDYWEVPGQVDNFLGWCAVNPADGLLYTSRAKYVDRDHGLRAFARHDGYPYPDDIPLRDADGAPIAFGAIQGGVFSRKGNLYLSSDTYTDDEDHPGFGGIVGFDSAADHPGELVRHRTISVKVEHHEDDGEELQDLTVWDLDRGGEATAEGCAGQFHILMLDNDGGTWPFEDDDDLYFKHYRVPEDAKDLI